MTFFIRAAEDAADGAAPGSFPPLDLQRAVAEVLAMDKFVVKKVTKSHKKMTNDVRAQLLQMEEVRRPLDCPLAEAAPAVLGQLAMESLQSGAGWGIVK